MLSNAAGQGLNGEQKEFLTALEGFLKGYPNFAKGTPFNQALAAKFTIRLTNSGNSCRNWCWDPINEEFFCC
jgi:hypothetical protein